VPHGDAGGPPISSSFDDQINVDDALAIAEQVDIDKDGSIDYREFKDGCKARLVKKSG
jgi:Ca2+-binding EF-hand superfamily protein